MRICEMNDGWPSQLDGSGRLLIPAEARHVMGWPPNTEVMVESDGHSLRVLKLDDFTKEVQAEFGPWKPGESLLSDELLSERRREAGRERHS